MESLLKSKSGSQKNNVHKEIAGHFGHPYAGPVKKIPEYYIHEDRKADKEENETCQCDTEVIKPLQLLVGQGECLIWHDKAANLKLYWVGWRVRLK